MHRGPIDDKQGSKRRKRRLLCTIFVRERINDTITFPLVDVSWVLQSHEDALILTLRVGELDVRRILVDLSSSTDLLQMLAYKPMDYLPSALENPGHLLSDFNGSTTTLLGDVVLSIQVGSITLNVRFSMIDNLSLYNAIMGRAWLQKMKAIPSTHHQMVSYITEEGQVDLFGSQLAMCQCYQVVLEFEDPAGEEAHSEPSNAREQ